MRTLVRVGAIATLNLLCCSSFVQAVDATNKIEVESNIFQPNVLKSTLVQNVTPANLKSRFAINCDKY